MAKTKMTENSRKVFDFLKGNGVGTRFITKDVQTALGFEHSGSVTGSINGLYKKGFVDKVTEEREVDGKTKKVCVFWLTEAGANFDPDAPVAE